MIATTYLAIRIAFMFIMYIEMFETADDNGNIHEEDVDQSFF